MATVEGPTWSVRTVRSRPDVVEVEAVGAPVTVWCDDAPLSAIAEAWGTALCLPAARAGARLALPGPVDPHWRAGVAANVADAAAWWGGSSRLVLQVPDATDRPGIADRHDPAAQGRALCFTAGVDSFFSLLASRHHVSHLLFVVGYDMALGEVERTAQTVVSVRAVAREVGVEAIVVRTDLRAHEGFSSVSWEHTHGAALAMVGHLLAPTVGSVVIPPSYARSRLVPWGSRPDLDARWSVPGRLTIEHGDASGRRLDRVLAIAHHPLVHRHLRVCWRNVDGLTNCGRCEKCVRTMVMFAGADQLQHCATFPDRSFLPHALDDLDGLEPGLLPMWADLVVLPLRLDERTAVDSLLARSG
ncbi:MAG: hypothetical protein ACR2MB_07650 [Acidimicrobiales bacterium]